MPAKVRVYRRVLADIYGSDLPARRGVWLDIGCGHGEFLIAMKRASMGHVALVGIEPNQSKARSARDRGLEVDYFDLASDTRRYDAISFLNVYSHLTNPAEFFGVVKERLKPGGELLLQTGDTADLPAAEHPRPFLLPDHLSFASEKIVLQMLASAGFDVLQVRKYPAVHRPYLGDMLLRETIKLVVPGKRSKFREFWSLFKANRHKIDMWIRARRPS